MIEAQCPVEACEAAVLADELDRENTATACVAGHVLEVDWERIEMWQSDEPVWVPIFTPAEAVRARTDH
jgi:hypothetical protein